MRSIPHSPDNSFSYSSSEASERHASSQFSIERAKKNKARQAELESKGWKSLTWIGGQIWLALKQAKHQTEIEKLVSKVVEEKKYPTEKVGNPRYVSGEAVAAIMEEVKKRIGAKKR